MQYPLAMVRPLPWALAAALSCGFFATGPVAADQSNPVLEELFDALQFAADRGDARAIAAEILAVWAESGSDDNNRLLREGTAAMNRGANQTALRKLTELVEGAPDFAEGWNRRATLYFKMQRYDESISDMQHVLALEPNHFGAWSGLAQVYLRQNKPNEAADALRHALAANPHLNWEQQMLIELDARDDLQNI